MTTDIDTRKAQISRTLNDMDKDIERAGSEFHEKVDQIQRDRHSLEAELQELRAIEQGASIEVPWDLDSLWTHFNFLGFVWGEGTTIEDIGCDRLSNLYDGQAFTDAAGFEFVKACDGPVQGACVVTDGEYFCQFDCGMVVKPI